MKCDANDRLPLKVSKRIGTRVSCCASLVGESETYGMGGRRDYALSSDEIAR